MNKPTLASMIGQLFITGFRGDQISESDSIARDISKHSLGGVILFDKHLATGSKTNNITDAEQLKQLTASLQELSSEKLLIAVDQEGGRVNRFRAEFGFRATHSAAKLGKSLTTDLTRDSGEQVAAMLKDCGVNLNFAPVVDLNLNPENPIIAKVERSFSDRVERVVAHARAWIETHRKEGILTCLKHFPGHGSSKSDSHLGFVDISHTWGETELEPYKRLLKSHHADMIMVGHLYNEAIDSKYPATLSEETVTGLLRTRLGYDGPVITDDMQMKAITDKYGLIEACIMAIRAGVDLIIIGNNLEYDPKIFTTLQNALAQAVDSGTLNENRIREAYNRVQKLKSYIN